MMRRCPRFDRCSATVCPLDPDWHKRAYEARTDRLCPRLLEAAKPGGASVLRGALSVNLVERVLDTLPSICARYSTIARKLDAASSSGSRYRSGLALRRAEG